MSLFLVSWVLDRHLRWISDLHEHSMPSSLFSHLCLKSLPLTIICAICALVPSALAGQGLFNPLCLIFLMFKPTVITLSMQDDQGLNEKLFIRNLKKPGIQ